jgi:hypothetical protein
MTARLLIQCNACLTQFRVIVPDVPATHLPPKFCLYCGSTSTSPSQDSEQDFWEVMSETFKLPINVLQLFYTAWNQNDEGHTKFRDYLGPALKKVLEAAKE